MLPKVLPVRASVASANSVAWLRESGTRAASPKLPSPPAPSRAGCDDICLPPTSPQPLDRAGQWLLHSGIQDSEGGVARYYRSDLQRNNPVSTEITGYHASALVYLHAATGDEEYRDRAIATARFLTSRAWDADLRLFPFEYPAASPAYFFDCGIIIRGLIAVWRLTQDSMFLDTAIACGNGMLDAFDAGCDFHPVLELPSKCPAPRDPRWSRSSGCYQLKVGLAFHELAQEGADQRFEDVHLRLLNQALSGHSEFLPGDADAAKVMDRLHAYCYFLEGLLPSVPQPALAEGIQRVAHLLHTLAPTFVRSDVYAQLLRVRLYADRAGVLPLDRGTAALEADALAKFQARHDDPRIDGGFYFGIQEGQFLPYVNPVSTAFGMQALQMWHNYCDAAGLPYVRLLI